MAAQPGLFFADDGDRLADSSSIVGRGRYSDYYDIIIMAMVTTRLAMKLLYLLLNIVMIT